MIAKKKRYRVTVRTGETTVGSVMVEAKDRDGAARAGIDKLWTPEHAASGATPETHVERVSGEGG